MRNLGKIGIRELHPLALCLLILFGLGLYIGEPAESREVTQVTINYIETAPDPEAIANRIRAYVTVSGADQIPVEGISPADFEVLEDGRSVRLDQVSVTDDPVSIILAIDTSGSMLARDRSGRTAIESAKQAANSFIRQLSPVDRVAIFTFDNETRLVSDFSENHSSLRNTITDLSAKPNAATRLYDTAIAAVKKSAEIPKGRRAIILLTDGRDEKGGKPYSIHGLNDIIDAATTKTIRVPIYTIGVGPKVDSKELARLASLTGGRSQIAASPEELVRFYEILARQLKGQYGVEYLSRSSSGEHSLVVKVRHADRQGQDERRFWSPPLPGMQAPTVVIVTPAPEERVKGELTVQLQLPSGGQAVKVRYFVDGILKEENRTPPLDSFTWNTTGLTGGIHLLRVEAVNATGQIGAAETTVHVAVPTIEFISPAAGSTVKGSVPVRVSIASEEALESVRYFDGDRLLVELRSPPFDAYEWDVSQTASGPHELRVVVVNVARQTVTALRSVNIAPPVTEPAETSGQTFPWGIIGAAAVVLAGILAGVFTMKNRGKAQGKSAAAPTASPAPPMPDDDETIFFTGAEPQSPAPSATVSVMNSPGMESGQTFEITGTAKIGRHPQNEIHIEDKSVSRKHAEIYFDGSTYSLRDLGSRYGTIVNRHRISLDVTALYDGAQIQLGPRTVLEFHLAKIQEIDPDDATQQISSAENDDTMKIGS